MSGFQFSRDRAMKADDCGYVLAGGVFVGCVTKMTSFSNDTGSGGVEISLETITGQKVNRIRVYTQNKDRSENFAKSKIDSLLGILGIDNAPAVRDSDGNIEFPAVYNRRIAFALQRENFWRTDGSKGFKFNLLHFFFADSKKTFKEHHDGAPANTYRIPVVDIDVDDEQPPADGNHTGYSHTTAANTGTGNQPIDDDLPF